MGNPKVAGALATTAKWSCTIAAWYGGKYNGVVPASSGRVTWSTSRDVPGTISIEVPVKDQSGKVWDPGTDPLHPLARYGQELTVDIAVKDPVSGVEEQFSAGRYMLTDWSVDGAVVTVSGESMMRRISEDRFLYPASTRPDSSVHVEVGRLVSVGVPYLIDSALKNRRTPSMSWDESRIDSMKELAQAWPARLRETRDGVVAFLAPLPEVPKPELYFADGEGGTVVRAPYEDKREGVYNIVVARGQENGEDGKPSFQAAASQDTGPMRASGPYGRVPKFFSSKLITNYEEAFYTARTMLASSMRRAAVRKVTCAPDPRLWIDTPVSIKAGGVENWGYVSGFELPLFADDDMTVEVEVAE